MIPSLAIHLQLPLVGHGVWFGNMWEDSPSDLKLTGCRFRCHQVLAVDGALIAQGCSGYELAGMVTACSSSVANSAAR